MSVQSRLPPLGGTPAGLKRRLMSIVLADFVLIGRARDISSKQRSPGSDGRCAIAPGIGPIWAEHVQVWAGHGQVWAGIVQLWDRFPQFQPSSAKVDPEAVGVAQSLAKLGPNSAEFDLVRLNLVWMFANFGPESAEVSVLGPTQAELVQIRPRSTRLGPERIDRGPTFSNWRPNSANFGRIRPTLVLNRPTSDRIWAEFGQCRPDLDKSGACRSWTDFSQPKFSSLRPGWPDCDVGGYVEGDERENPIGAASGHVGYVMTAITTLVC